MKCPNCNKDNPSGVDSCIVCGTALPLEHSQPPTSASTYATPSRPNTYNRYYTPYITESQLPPEYRPLSAWAYFGYQLLFSLPIAGFILLIIFSFNDTNINRRNFARSYWCSFLIAASLLLVLLLLSIATFA